MIKKVLFWGAKFKAGIIYNLIKDSKIIIEKEFISKFLFDQQKNQNLSQKLNLQTVQQN